MRYLAVDPGGRKIGLAIGDDDSGVASPYGIEPYEGIESTARRIAELAMQVNATQVVLGLPTIEDGSRGPAARRTDHLAVALEEMGVEVDLQPEYLTTDEARRRARAAGRPTRHPVDDIAAQVLLEEYLASRRRAGNRRG